MGRARRVDRQGSRVTDIGDVVEHFQRIDKAPAGIHAALQLETEQPAIAAVQMRVGAPPGGALHNSRIDHLADLRMPRQRLRHRHRIGAMRPHAQRQCLQPLDMQE